MACGLSGLFEVALDEGLAVMANPANRSPQSGSWEPSENVGSAVRRSRISTVTWARYDVSIQGRRQRFSV